MGFYPTHFVLGVEYFSFKSHQTLFKICNESSWVAPYLILYFEDLLFKLAPISLLHHFAPTITVKKQMHYLGLSITPF
jgi:hypothetical protein